MKKFKRNAITKIVLSTLLAVGFITVALAAPNAVQIFKYFKPKNAYERERIKILSPASKDKASSSKETVWTATSFLPRKEKQKRCGID